MTQKIYKTAQGKTVDLGALMLQNENVRAVGNMNVNARGDVLDSGNKVIDQKNRQTQRQYQRQTNVSSTQVATSTRAAKRAKNSAPAQTESIPEVVKETQDEVEPVIEQATTEISEPIKTLESTVVEGEGGLAAAIARAKTVKQELEKTARQRAQEQPLKRL